MEHIEETTKRTKPLISILRSGIGHALGANVINKAVGMISSMIITRVMTTTDYGILGYALNIFSYLTLVSGLGLLSGNIQFGTENKGEGRAYAYYKYCLLVGLIIDILLVCISIGVISALELPLKGSKQFVLLYIPLLLFEYVIAIVQGILRSKNRIKEYARYLNLNSLAVAIGTCVGAFWGVLGVIVGRYFAAIITVAFSWLFLSDSVPQIFAADELLGSEKKVLWKFSFVIGACSALNLLVYSLDITLIANMIRSTEEVGLYKAGTLIPSALAFIPNSIITAVLPNIIYHKNELGWIRNRLKKTYIYLLGFNLILSATLILFAPLVMTLFAGKRYVQSAQVLRVLVAGYFFSGTFRGLSVNLLSAFRRVRYSLFISVSTCVADIVMNYYLIGKMGMIGAAYATLVVDILSAFLSFSYVYVLLKKGTINEFLKKVY